MSNPRRICRSLFPFVCISDPEQALQRSLWSFVSEALDMHLDHKDGGDCPGHGRGWLEGSLPRLLQLGWTLGALEQDFDCRHRSELPRLKMAQSSHVVALVPQPSLGRVFWMGLPRSDSALLVPLYGSRASWLRELRSVMHLFAHILLFPLPLWRA